MKQVKQSTFYKKLNPFQQKQVDSGIPYSFLDCTDQSIENLYRQLTNPRNRTEVVTTAQQKQVSKDLLTLRNPTVSLIASEPLQEAGLTLLSQVITSRLKADRQATANNTKMISLNDYQAVTELHADNIRLLGLYDISVFNIRLLHILLSKYKYCPVVLIVKGNPFEFCFDYFCSSVSGLIYLTSTTVVAKRVSL